MSKYKNLLKPSLFALAIYALSACSQKGNEKAPATPDASKQTAPAAAVTGSGVELPSFVNLVKQEGPAVVNISATRDGDEEDMQEGDPLNEFFRRFGGVPGLGEAPAS